MSICIGSGLTVNSAGQLEKTNSPTCRVFHSVNQSIPHNTSTTLAFNSESYDNDIMHDNVTNNNRITFTTAGVYVITASIEFTQATDYTDIVGRIRIDGSIFLELDIRIITTWTHGGDPPIIQLGAIRKLSAGSYVEILVSHVNSAAAARDVLRVADRSTIFSATRLGTG